MTGPWTFEQAMAACQQASQRQRAAEDAMREASVTFAEAEEAYRKALAVAIVTKHDTDGVAWTVAPDLARGDPLVARLRRERDIAEGVREASQQAAWRRAADRKDAQRFADWSQRREVAENGQPDERLAWKASA
jgi:chlorite dismutase